MVSGHLGSKAVEQPEVRLLFVVSEELEGQDPVVGICRTFLRKVFHQLEESESQDPVGGVGVAPVEEEELEELNEEEETEGQETCVGVGSVSQGKL